MRRALLTLVLASLVAPVAVFAQSAEITTYKLTGARIAIGQDVRVERDEEVMDAAVVILGSLTVEGRVRDGIVVVGGDLHLGPASDVRGEIVLVGGKLTRDTGAQQSGTVNYVSFGEWSRFATAWFPAFPFGGFGEFRQWINLAGTLGRVSLLAVLMALMLIVARAPVARVGRAAAAEPLRAAVIGFAAELFFIPLLVVASIALAITIIGIPVVAILVPLAFVVAAFALVLGYTALACRLGEWLEDRFGWQPGNAFVSTALGFFLIVGPTLAARLIGLAPQPLRFGAFALLLAGLAIEFVVWTIGFGAAIMTGLGRWYTVPPPIVVQSNPPSPSAPGVAY